MNSKEMMSSVTLIRRPEAISPGEIKFARSRGGWIGTTVEIQSTQIGNASILGYTCMSDCKPLLKE